MKTTMALYGFLALLVFHFETASAQSAKSSVTASPKAAAKFQPATVNVQSPSPASAIAPQGAQLSTQEIQTQTPSGTGVATTQAAPTTTFIPRPNIGEDSKADDNENKKRALEIIKNYMNAASKSTGIANTPANTQQLIQATSPTQYPSTNEAYDGLLSTSMPSNLESMLVGYDCDHQPQTNRYICMVCNTVFEACNQEPKGQTEVARTVLTRVYNDNYKKTVCENVYFKVGKSAAFSWTLERKDHRLTAGKCLNNAVRATKEAFALGPNGFDHYYNNSIANPPWGKGTNSCRNPTQVESHLFCTESGNITRTRTEVAAAENIPLSAVGGSPGSEIGR